MGQINGAGLVYRLDWALPCSRVLGQAPILPLPSRVAAVRGQVHRGWAKAVWGPKAQSWPCCDGVGHHAAPPGCDRAPGAPHTRIWLCSAPVYYYQATAHGASTRSSPFLPTSLYQRGYIASGVGSWLWTKV